MEKIRPSFFDKSFFSPKFLQHFSPFLARIAKIDSKIKTFFRNDKKKFLNPVAVFEFRFLKSRNLIFQTSNFSPTVN